MIGKWSTNNAMVPKSYEDFLTLNLYCGQNSVESVGRPLALFPTDSLFLGRDETRPCDASLYIDIVHNTHT